MDFLSELQGNATNSNSKTAIEYTAQASSTIVSGEVRLTLDDDGLTVTALFDTAKIAFSEINALEITNYVITVKADSGDYFFSHMGNWCLPFYEALSDTYNKAVLRSLFINEKPIITAKGDYNYIESGVSNSGATAIHVYENNVAILPPDVSARRVPLCFVTGMDKGNYELTLSLDTGERYTYAKLGYDTAPFADAVERQIRKLREDSIVAVLDIDPTLTTAQASQIAKLMPRGAAVSFGRLTGLAPSFAAALIDKIDDTRAAEYYNTLCELNDPLSIWVGFRKNDTANDTSIESGFVLDQNISESKDSDAYLIWLIAPSPDGRFAVVEFAEADSATFVYDTDGDFDSFAKKINRALEAIDFKREVIRLSDLELRKPENADYYMAAKRTSALQLVRSKFVGRVIHSSPVSWKRKLMEMCSSGPIKKESPAPTLTEAKFCVQCGATIAPGMKFCGICGFKIG